MMTLGYRFQWNVNRNSIICDQENTFENFVCKMSSILFRLQCVKVFVSLAFWTVCSREPCLETRRSTCCIYPDVFSFVLHHLEEFSTYFLQNIFWIICYSDDIYSDEIETGATVWRDVTSLWEKTLNGGSSRENHNTSGDTIHKSIHNLMRPIEEELCLIA